jgi:hypothetical protein
MRADSSTVCRVVEPAKHVDGLLDEVDDCRLLSNVGDDGEHLGVGVRLLNCLLRGLEACLVDVDDRDRFSTTRSERASSRCPDLESASQWR